VGRCSRPTGNDPRRAAAAPPQSHFPRIAGILLTDAPDESALPRDAVEILHGLETVGIPVLCVPLDTYTATSRLQGPQGLPPGGLLTPSSTVKLQAISDLFLQSTCNEFIGTVLQGKTARTEMTSYIFQVRRRRPGISEYPK
jgi:hypothetical protein